MVEPEADGPQVALGRLFSGASGVRATFRCPSSGACLAEDRADQPIDVGEVGEDDLGLGGLSSSMLLRPDATATTVALQ
jgi:hypothetical protein